MTTETTSADDGTSSDLADVVVIAAAEAFRGDGETLAIGIGTIQTLGARTARGTFEPDLLISDGGHFSSATSYRWAAPRRSLKGGYRSGAFLTPFGQGVATS